LRIFILIVKILLTVISIYIIIRIDKILSNRSLYESKRIYK